MDRQYQVGINVTLPHSERNADVEWTAEQISAVRLALADAILATLPIVPKGSAKTGRFSSGKQGFYLGGKVNLPA